MTNFWKYAAVFIAAIGLVGWILWWTKTCPPCKVCPEVVTNRTVTKDTVIIHDSVSVAKIRLTKVDKPEIVKPVTAKDCDSINALYNSSFTYQIPVSDSIMTGHVTQTVSQNKITDFSTSFTYLIPHQTDSVIQYVDRPVYKNTFTIGSWVSKYSSGVAVGYRSKRVHGAFGWDFTNSAPVVQVNYDLR